MVLLLLMVLLLMLFAGAADADADANVGCVICSESGQIQQLRIAFLRIAEKWPNPTRTAQLCQRLSCPPKPSPTSAPCSTL
jgi:hypothetical protein